MKKLLTIVLCLALTATLTACVSKVVEPSAPVASSVPVEPAASAEPTAQMPNPMVEQQSADAFSALGIKMDAPEGASNIKYYIIDSSLADVRFTLDGVDYTYRASKTEKDISGVYDTFTNIYTISMVRDFDNLTLEAAKGSEDGTLVTWSAEGVNYSLYTSSTVDEAAMKIVAKAVLEKTFTGVEYAVSDYPGYTIMKDNHVLSIDLDNDGVMETVRIEVVTEQDYELAKRRIKVERADGTDTSVELDIWDWFTCYVLDADGDGKIELLASGDVESCDYITYMLRYEGGELVLAKSPYDDVEGWLAPSASGNVVDIKDGVIVIEDQVDILGTWSGRTEYTVVSEPFSLARVPGSVYKRDASQFDPDYWSYCTLTTVRELPVTLDGESAKSMLEVGVKLYITETDYETYVAFITEDGRRGRIAVTQDVENWGWLIDGVHESEYFESVPYAG